jgi:hypothetical protein
VEILEGKEKERKRGDTGRQTETRRERGHTHTPTQTRRERETERVTTKVERIQSLDVLMEQEQEMVPNLEIQLAK